VPLGVIRQLPGAAAPTERLGRGESAPRAEVTDATDNTAEMTATARAAWDGWRDFTQSFPLDHAVRCLFQRGYYENCDGRETGGFLVDDGDRLWM